MSLVKLFYEFINKPSVCWFSLILVTFFWGSTFILVKMTIEIIPPMVFLSIRFSLASIVSLPFVFSNGSDSSNDLNLLKKIKLGGIVGIFLWLSFMFQTIGLQFTSPTVAAFLTGLNVIFTPIIASVLFNTRITKGIAFGAFLAFSGVAFLSGIFDIDLSTLKGTQQLFGSILIIICAVAIALHILATGKYSPVINMNNMLFYQLLVAAFLSIMSMFIMEEVNFDYFNPFYWEPIIWLTLTVTVLFATVFAYLVQSYYQSKELISASQVAIIFSFEPIFATLVSLVVLSENLSLFMFLGSILIFIGMIMARPKDETSH